MLLNENYVINGSGVAASDEYLSLRGHAVNMRVRKGPDEVMEAEEKTAKLMRIVEGAEEVEKMDALLSLAITGGDYNWF